MSPVIPWQLALGMVLFGFVVYYLIVSHWQLTSWDDEVDDHWGRGSIKDEWLYDRIDQNGGRKRNGNGGPAPTPA